MQITFDLTLLEDDLVEGWFSCPELASNTKIGLKKVTVGSVVTALHVIGVDKTNLDALEDVLRGV